MAFDLDDDELRETRKMKNLDRELTVGEYVRTKDGKIGVFKGYNNNRKSQWACKVELQNMKLWKYYEEENIVKHSKIISEVVEVGDYVNGKLIHKIDKGPNYCYLYYENCKTFVDYQIKKILTKELYKANCYKVGGE